MDVFPWSGLHFDEIAEFDRSNISPLLLLYLGFLLQTKARWTLIRLVRAQIDILHGDENVCLEAGVHQVANSSFIHVPRTFCAAIVRA